MSLENSLNDSSGYEIIATSYGINIQHKKLGFLHFLRLVGNISDALTTHSFTIPSEYAPLYYLVDHMKVGAVICDIVIEANGKLTITAASTLSKNMYINKNLIYI